MTKIKSNKKTVSKKAPVKRKQPANDYFYDEWDAYARKRSAWGEYSATMHSIRANEEEYKLKHGSEEEKEKIKRDRNGRSPMLYIG